MHIQSACKIASVVHMLLRILPDAFAPIVEAISSEKGAQSYAISVFLLSCYVRWGRKGKQKSRGRQEGQT